MLELITFVKIASRGTTAGYVDMPTPVGPPVTRWADDWRHGGRRVEDERDWRRGPDC